VSELGVRLGASVDVATNGVGVEEGVRVGVGDEGTVVLVGGGEVRVAVGVGWMKKSEIPPQEAVTIRMNIIIKKRRMDIL